MSALRVSLLVRRIGPYHDARFRAAGRLLNLVVVETRPTSNEYPWTTHPGARGYRVEGFPAAAVAEAGLRGTDLERETARVLERAPPEVLACSGWADPEYHVALRWCQRRGIPAVVMSDSTFEDEPRQPWREWLKGPLVRGYAAAIAAGTRSRGYLQRLGFPAGAIFQPWDVVDNQHLATEVDRLRNGADRVPPQFLCVARFIPKKNLGRLLAAYAGYLGDTGGSGWGLVLAGSGPLEPELREQAAALGVAAQIRFTGFRQYPELPALYAGAGALVLPSTSDQWGLVVNEAMAAGLPVIVSDRCGCAPDLVREDGNGWRFDPLDVAALQACLARAARLEFPRWAALGRCARETVAAYTPEDFARALEQAAGFARAQVPVRTPPLARALVHLMAARTAFSR